MVSRAGMQQKFLVGAAVLTVAAAACTTTQGHSATAAGGTTLRVVQETQVQSLDPNVDSFRTSERIGDEILQAPTQFVYSGSQLVLRPNLAESWTQTSPTTWRFTLRPGIKFTDGEPLNSQAIVSTLASYRLRPQGGNTFVFSNVTISAVNSQIFTVTTKVANDGALPAQMSYFYVYPPKYFKQMGPNNFGNAPVGTGPYMLSQWKKGVSITLKANPHYWGPEPSIKTLVFTFVADPATRLAELATGQVDMAADLPPAFAGRLKATPNAKAVTLQGMTRIFLAFGTTTSPANSLLVRKAIEYAINPSAIIKSIFNGHAYAFHGIFVPGELGYNPGFKGYSYNPAEAKKLLAQAGHPNGLTIPLDYTIGSQPNDQEVAEAIQGQLQQVGITSVMNGGPGQLVTAKWLQPDSPGLHLLNYNPVYPEASFLFVAYFATGSAWQNLASDSSLTQMAAQALGTTNQSKRNAIYEQAQNYAIASQALWVPLYTQQDIYGVAKNVNWSARPDELFAFQNASIG